MLLDLQVERLQVHRKFHEEAGKFREYASSLEKEYVSALEKKYYLLYHSTANLLHAMNASKNIIKADEEFTGELEPTKQKTKLKPIPSYPSFFQEAQEKFLAQLPSLSATSLRRESEHTTECFRPKRSKEKEKRKKRRPHRFLSRILGLEDIESETT